MVDKAGAVETPAQAASSAAATLRALYSTMQSIENQLGGGEGVEGLYGSITLTGTRKIMSAMTQHCDLGSESVLVDIGAGLGRPLLHALVEPGVKSAHGVELDRIKVDKAEAFLKQTVQRLQARGLLLEGLALPSMQCAAIEQVAALTDCTHAYSFWEGVPHTAREAFGRLCACSSTLRGLAVVQRAMRTDPCGAMADMGFGGLTLAASFPVSMSGSGRSFTAYVFRREPGAAPSKLSACAAGGVPTPVQTRDRVAAASSAATSSPTPTSSEAAKQPTGRQARAAARAVAARGRGAGPAAVPSDAGLGRAAAAAAAAAAPAAMLGVASGKEGGQGPPDSDDQAQEGPESQVLAASKQPVVQGTSSAWVSKRVSPVKPVPQGRLPFLRQRRQGAVLLGKVKAAAGESTGQVDPTMQIRAARGLGTTLAAR